MLTNRRPEFEQMSAPLRRFMGQSTTMNCFACGSDALIRCSVCKTRYCSRHCQEEHWPMHLMVCRPVPDIEPVVRPFPDTRALRRPIQRPNPLRCVTSVEVPDQNAPSHERVEHQAPVHPHFIGATAEFDAANVSTASISTQLLSQLDLQHVGDVFECHRNTAIDGRHGFDAIFIEELTLVRIGHKMQEHFKDLSTKTKLNPNDLEVGKLVIVHVSGKKDAFQRAMIIGTEAGTNEVELLLIDYARPIKVNSTTCSMYEALPLLKKYRALGLWFEPTATSDKLTSFVGPDGLLQVKIMAHTLNAAKCTDYIVASIENDRKIRCEFIVHPWYKLSKVATDFILQGHEFRAISRIQIPDLVQRMSDLQLESSATAKMNECAAVSAVMATVKDHLPQGPSHPKVDKKPEATVHKSAANEMSCPSSSNIKSVHATEVKAETKPAPTQMVSGSKVEVDVHAATASSNHQIKPSLVDQTPSVTGAPVEKPALPVMTQPTPAVGPVRLDPEPSKPIAESKIIPAKPILLSDLASVSLKVGDQVIVTEMTDVINRFIINKMPDCVTLIEKIGQLITKEMAILNSLPPVNSVITAKWTSVGGDGNKYRAVVKQVKEDDNTVVVNFIDFGNDSTEPLSSLSSLPPELATRDFPAVASVITLSDVPERVISSLVDDTILMKFVEVVSSMQREPALTVKAIGADGSLTLALSNGAVVNETLKEIFPPKVSDIGHVKVNEGDAVSFACVGETSNEINVLNLMIADKLEKISTVLMNPEALIPLKANEEPIVDQLVACKWTSEGGDQNVYRAVVTAVNTNLKRVKVLFIDYGNRSVEPFSSLSILPSTVATSEYPCMASPVTLTDVPSESMAGNTSLSETLNGFYYSMALPFTVSATLDAGGKKHVTLMSADGKDINSEVTKILNPSPKVGGNQMAADLMAKLKGRM